MIKIYDKENGAWRGTIDEKQLQFLMEQMEEETTDDQDYYINETSRCPEWPHRNGDSVVA